MKRTFSVILAILTCIIFFMPTQSVKADEYKKLSVHVIPLTDKNGKVGQGDAVLLESNGNFLLMDTGIGDYKYSNDPTLAKLDVSGSIMKYLDSMGLNTSGKTLDIYISHTHNDHFGGMYNIINSGKYNIKKIYVPAKTIGCSYTTAEYPTGDSFPYKYVFTNEGKSYDNYDENIKVVYLAPKTINCGSEKVVSNFLFGDCTVDIIGPVKLCTKKNFPKGSKDQIENNNSLCAMISCGNCKYLTMGDAIEQEELDLIAKYEGTKTLQADLFKENHHGYAESDGYNSNIAKLLSVVQAKYAFCQNNKLQSNVTVPRYVSNYGITTDMYYERNAVVYQLETYVDGSKRVTKSYCNHEISGKSITGVPMKFSECKREHLDKFASSPNKERIDEQHHILKVVCSTCGKVVETVEQHRWDGSGKCVLCGYQCNHKYIASDGSAKYYYMSKDCVSTDLLNKVPTCYNCRTECQHKEWWPNVTKYPGKGECKSCYILCSHPSWDSKTNKCKTCGREGEKKSFVKVTSPKSYKLSTTKYTYNGKKKSPGVTVINSSGKKLVKNTDFTILYPSGRINVGKYTVKITCKGKYSGTKKLNFVINPPKTAIEKLTKNSKSFDIKWKKKTSQVSGYEIQYSTSSSFKSGNKTVKITSAKTISKTIKGLKEKKKYYVRIRTYKTVSGKKYYSDWSSAKSVTTKK